MAALNDKELTILDAISRNSLISQRELAKSTGVSLGLINVILKKFIKTGYVQASRLNKRKLEYVLTPQGFLAVTRKTYQYATRTIRDYRRLHQQLSALLLALEAEGIRYFSIHGDGELRELLETIIPYICKEKRAVSLGREHREDPDSIVLNVSTEPLTPEFSGKVISVIERIERLASDRVTESPRNRDTDYV